MQTSLNRILHDLAILNTPFSPLFVKKKKKAFSFKELRKISQPQVNINIT